MKKTSSDPQNLAEVHAQIKRPARLQPAQLSEDLPLWAGIIVIIKIVNQIIALIYIKRFCFPHTVANKLTGFLLFIAVPTIDWFIIPIAIVAIIATFAALQEWHSIRNKIDIV